MKWLTLTLAGPGIWAGGFSLVYALHGAGCALGWTDIGTTVTLHHAALWAGWLATLAAGALLLVRLPPAPEGTPLRQSLPRMGAWIGLVASAVTLLPVAITTSC